MKKKILSLITITAISSMSILIGCGGGTTSDGNAGKSDGSEINTTIDETTDTTLTENTSNEHEAQVLPLYTRYYYYDGSFAASDEYTYDENGTLLKCTYSESGEISYTDYKYDENGNCIEEVYYDESGETTSKTEHTYDENGNCIEDIYYWEDEISSKKEYAYDANNNQIEYRSYYFDSGNAELSEREEYTYDDNGILLEQNLYNAERITNKLKYDSHENLIEKIYYQDNGEIESCEKHDYTYDTYGNPILYAYGSNVAVYWTYDYTYTYDDNGNILKCVKHYADAGENPSREYLSTSEYIYDENGNCIEDISYYENGDVSGKTEYTYDENGNLIKQIDYTCTDNEYFLAEESEWVVFN